MSLRHHHRKPCLLESNDYHSRADSTSIIGFDPLVEIVVSDGVITISQPDGEIVLPIERPETVTRQLIELTESFDFVQPVTYNGFLSYFSFEYAHMEEGIAPLQDSMPAIPKAHLILYKYLIVLDHFHDTGTIIRNDVSPIEEELDSEAILRKKPFAELPFTVEKEETTPVSEAGFCSMVEKSKQHILRGDVFQLVVSRPFSQPFFGDDFQVYRQLRRLNPSPYLFYIDMESYRLMGSSPETQIQLKKGKASIHPIAGTVRKTGDEELDRELTNHLINDEKENAEHTMLVDLARNDLSKYCTSVAIESYKEIQQFSHVIHLVSKVSGELDNTHPLQLFSGTFPAGTLSGTPKYRALELIRDLEGNTRDYYGGAVGFLGADGSMNFAIVIRSLLSHNNVLHYRAGAGVVLDSVPENELQEVSNKLGAVRKAIHAAAVKPQLV